MSFSVRVAATTPTRPCKFCLVLQHDSVFADFDVDEKGCVRLLRISFDGYGCCHTDRSSKMDQTASRLLITAVDRGDVGDLAIEMTLRDYFRANSEIIWKDALTEHDLL